MKRFENTNSIQSFYKFSNILKYNNFLFMNSSTGFKKRPLLRPPSGMRQREKEYLKAFDVSQAEPMIASQVKNELLRIQDEINELDKDKKIRSVQGSSLQKSYVLTLKKWLLSAASCEKEDDDMKIMKYMGVDSYEAGFRKLWKVISSLDNMITKITELEIIQFLKYDDMFDQFTKDSQKSAMILSTISKAGFTAGTFQVSQVLLDRSKDLYEHLMESKRRGSGFVTSLEKQSSKNQTNELISQLQKQNSKLTELLEELDKQKENNQKLMKELKCKEEIIKVNQNISNNANKQVTSNQSLSSNPSEAFRQLEDRYTQRMAYLSSQISKLQSHMSQQKIAMSALETRARLAQDDLKDKDATKGLKPKSGSYEEALLQEMQKMKKGFEKKIQKIMQEAGNKEKEMRKKEVDYRNQNEKVKWEKNLLLKKFQTLEQSKSK